MLEIELKILKDIYDMDFNRGKTISYKKYDLGEDLNNLKRNVFGKCLLKLERLGYIEMDEGAIVCAGTNESKYSVNVVSFLYKKMHISKDGIKLIESLESEQTRSINWSSNYQNIC